MRKIKNLVIGGIETKIFNLILITMIIFSVAFMVINNTQSNMLTELTAETGEKQLAAMTNTTDTVMEAVVVHSLGRQTEMGAMLSDTIFADLEKRVQLLGEYAQQVFEHPERYPAGTVAAPDPAKAGEVSVQLILAEGAEVSDERLGTAAAMSGVMTSLCETFDAPDMFVGLPEGAFLMADRTPEDKYAEDGTLKFYDPSSRFWYKQAVEEGKLVFTDVESDAFTGNVGIVCAMPIYVNGELQAVVGADLYLNNMREQVVASDADGGFQIVVNHQGHVIFSPRESGLFQVRSTDNAVDLRQNENEELAAMVKDALAAQTDVRLIDTSEGSYYIAGAPMPTVGWAVMSLFRAETAEEPAAMIRGRFEEIQNGATATYREKSNEYKKSGTILFIGVTVLLLAATMLLGKRIVRPLNQITKRIAELDTDHPEFTMRKEYETGDEIQVLAESFADLSHKTVQYVQEVQRVTAEKERIGTELAMAKQIQEGVLPSIFPAFPDRPEFDIYASMDPAKEVGGDFYDFFLIDDDHLALVMADVSGKGVPGALFMMASKIILQTNAMQGGSPAEILSRMNRAVCRNNPMEMFVTVWLGILEISTGKLVAANAGHEYPVIRRADGTFEMFKDRHGFVIGGMDGIRYKEYSLQLEPGEKLFLYTDGLPEATDAEEKMYGTERMIEALNKHAKETPDEILASMHRAVDDFVGGAEQFDDLTMLCLEYKGKQN